jgi:mannose-6-phosphate isomerase-like protein (cupin superfamily)
MSAQTEGGDKVQLKHADAQRAKGWYAGPWDRSFLLPVGYANAGIDDPHLHMQMTEVYLIARGTAEVRIDQDTIRVEAGDMLVVDPGEAHTFLTNSPEYFHFVLQMPGLSPEEVRAERITVSRARLGL